MLTFKAPAKINLTLEVLGKRPDGFHEIRSVMQSVELFDTITLTLSNETIISGDMLGWSAERSLVSRTIELLRENTGCTQGVSIEIIKKIPLLSGLGGDSSDAAAVLKGLNELWGLGMTAERLVDIASQLGSDFTFFLRGGTALATGRGEVITPLPSLVETWFALVLPEIPQNIGKTARMYRSLEAAHYTDGKITEKLVRTIKHGDRITDSLLFNAFENIAYDDFVIRHVYVEHLEKLGASRVHLTGSGPALFVFFDDRNAAEDFFIRCRDQGMKVYNVATRSS